MALCLSLLLIFSYIFLSLGFGFFLCAKFSVLSVLFIPSTHPSLERSFTFFLFSCARTFRPFFALCLISAALLLLLLLVLRRRQPLCQGFGWPITSNWRASLLHHPTIPYRANGPYRIIYWIYITLLRILFFFFLLSILSLSTESVGWRSSLIAETPGQYTLHRCCRCFAAHVRISERPK